MNNSQDALLIKINYYITYIYLYLKKKILTNIPHFCGFIPIVHSGHLLISQLNYDGYSMKKIDDIKVI